MTRAYRQRIPPKRIEVANLILANHSFEDICRLAGLTPAGFIKHRQRIASDLRIRVIPQAEKPSKIDLQIDEALNHLINLIRTKHAQTNPPA